MSLTSYEIGDKVRLTGTFTTVNGDPVDPDTVVLEVRYPDGSVDAYTGGDLAHPSTGVFTYDVLIQESGPWVYNFTGSGNLNVSTGDRYFSVDQSAVVAG